MMGVEEEQRERRLDQRIYDRVKEQTWTGQFLGPHSYGFHVTPRGVINSVCEQNLPYDGMPAEEYTSYIQDTVGGRKETIENIPENRAKRMASVAKKFNDGAVYLGFRSGGMIGGSYGVTQESMNLPWLGGVEQPVPQIVGAGVFAIAARGVPSTVHSMQRFYSNIEPGTEHSQVELYEEAVNELDEVGVEDITDEIVQEYFHPLGAKHRLAFYDEQDDVWRRAPYMGWKDIITNSPQYIREKLRNGVDYCCEKFPA